MWQEIKQRYTLSDKQLEQLQRYAAMLIEWNEKFNLTAITQEKDVLMHHIKDSLELSHCIDLSTIKGIADIGSGGGLPGIPLAILNPDCLSVLIEVTSKKVSFLEHVAKELGLVNVQVYSQDWLTFLRKTDYKIDLMCARASLQVDDLLRALRPSSPYAHAQLVYWASRHWKPTEQQKKLLKEEYNYTVGDKERRYIIFSGSK